MSHINRKKSCIIDDIININSITNTNTIIYKCKKCNKEFNKKFNNISHINNIPVVAHGTKHFITTTYLSFDKFLDIILEYGFNTSDPLILFLEIFNEDNEILMNNIKNILLTKLSTRIAKLSYPDDYIADKPIINFLNKILIFGSNSNILSNIIYSNLNFINIPDQHKEIKNTNILGRVYKTPGFWSSLSVNVNFKKFHKKKYNMVTMNYQMNDKLLYEYMKFFKQYSIIHFSEKK
jgi:hypothetical protein